MDRLVERKIRKGLVGGLMILSLLVCAGMAQAESEWIVLSDGSVLEGSVEVRSASFRVTQAGRVHEVARDQVRSWVRPVKMEQARSRYLVEAVDGSLLPAEVIDWKDGSSMLALKSPKFGILRVPVADLAVIHRQSERGAVSFFLVADGGAGQVNLLDGSMVEGRVVSLSRDQVLVRTPGGDERIKLSEITRVVIPVGGNDALPETELRVAVQRVDQGGWYATVRRTDGSRLHGIIQNIDARNLLLATGWGGVFEIPLKEVRTCSFGMSPSVIRGRTLVVDSNAGTIVAIDRQGNRVDLLKRLSNPHDIDILDDGRLLVAERGRSMVVQLDLGQRVTFNSDSVGDPTSVAADGEGGYWICDLTRDKLYHLDRKGAVQKKIDRLSTPVEVDVLDNGNLLVCEIARERVVELTPEGKVVWEIGEVGYPADADRLPGGNTLITDTDGSRVIEVDREGNIVWTISGLSAPFDSDRLPGGNTLVVENRMGRVREFDPLGREVWMADGFRSPLEVERE